MAKMRKSKFSNRINSLRVNYIYMGVLDIIIINNFFFLIVFV